MQGRGDRAGGASLGLRGQLLLLTTGTAVGAAGLFTVLGYRAEERAALRGVDGRLRAAAAAMPTILPDGYQARAAARGVGEGEHGAIVGMLTEYASRAGVAYAYTCIEREGEILQTASSATAREREAGTWARLLDPYVMAPAALREAIADGVERIADYTDEFGSFRSIFMPFEEGELRYVAAADIRLNEVRAMARENLVRHALTGAAMAAVLGVLGALLGRRIARPIERLRRGVESFGDEDFTNDEASVAELTRLASRRGDETGELAWTLVEMQSRLVRHIGELTRVTAEKEHMTAQLELAREIQRGLLPEGPPGVRGFEAAGLCEPAEQTGGDFYDWSRAGGGWFFCLADATGHGVGPAIIASVCSAYASALLQVTADLHSFMERLNRLVCKDTRGGQFVTFFAAMLEGGRLRVLSAGHGPGLVLRAGGAVEEVPTHGPPLGVMEEVEFDAVTEIGLEEGEVLLVTSDGFFEWRNGEGEQFGVGRLKEALRRCAGLSAGEVVERVRGEVLAFTAGTKQPDDMTAVAVRRWGG